IRFLASPPKGRSRHRYRQAPRRDRCPCERSRTIMAQLVHPASRGLNEKLTIAEVCAELKISRSTFYDWRAKRRAPRCITLPNGSLRIRRADLDRWLGAHEDVA